MLLQTGHVVLIFLYSLCAVSCGTKHDKYSGCLDSSHTCVLVCNLLAGIKMSLRALLKLLYSDRKLKIK